MRGIAVLLVVLSANSCTPIGDVKRSEPDGADAQAPHVPDPDQPKDSVPEASETLPQTKAHMDSGGCSADAGTCTPMMAQCASASGCTDCRPGYIGTGPKGCTPQLTGLSVSCGANAAPAPIALTEGTYEYSVKVPVTCQSVTLMAAVPVDAQLVIDDVTVQPDSAWNAPQLHIGDNPVKLVVSTAESGRRSSYQLRIERAGAHPDFLKASNADHHDGFGFAIAAVGGTLIVGAPFEYGNGSSPSDNSAGNAGAVYVFELANDNWAEKQYLKAPSPRSDDFFGATLAVSDDLIVVGAPHFNIGLFKVVAPTDSGAAHVFSRQGSVWTHEAVLLAEAGSGADLFGFHVAIQGERVLVGAPYDSAGGTHAGAVYSFVRSGGAWKQEQKVLASSPIADSSLGVSLAIEGELLVAGAQQDSSTSEAAGSAYVFAREADRWKEQQRLQAPKPQSLATFGVRVALNTGRILVTAPGLDLKQRATPAGEAFLFQRASASARWEVTAQLRASAPRAVDLFGGAAALTPTTIVIGANGDASSALGIDGDAARTDAALSGATHVFGLQGSDYARSAYIKAFNSGADDCYGQSVAVTDAFLAVGSPYEASSQRGISSEDNANGADNSAHASGAVYVYR